MTASSAVCIVGFGEVGSNWTRTLIDAGYDPSDITILYLAHDRGRVAATRVRAGGLGVRLVDDPAGVPPSTRMFLHATTAASAEAVLERCLPHVAPDQVWVDLNSTGPSMKARMAVAAEGVGAAFADGAIMAPAWKLGHRTPVWVAGPGSSFFTAWAEQWGMPTVTVDGPPGAAASIKMCRSLILKGLAASLVEGLAVAQLAGVEEHVRRSLSDDLGVEIVELFSQRFIRPTLQHAGRRAAEVDEAVEMAEGLGWVPLHAEGVSRFLARVDDVGGSGIAARNDDSSLLLSEFAAAYAGFGPVPGKD